jgi:hypothetical protein
MLVTFRCKGHANITFFGDVAKQLLKWMGHSGTIPSALTEQDISHALISLQKVVHQLPQDDLSLQTADNVTLRHRALPLIGLLEHAQKHHYHVMWD